MIIMLKKVRQLLFLYEKPRYYSGGAFRHSQMITQKFWDDMKERKQYYENLNANNPGFQRIDTTWGSADADIGDRPITPDWIIKFREDFMFITGLIGWCIIGGFILSRFMHQC